MTVGNFNKSTMRITVFFGPSYLAICGICIGMFHVVLTAFVPHMSVPLVKIFLSNIWFYVFSIFPILRQMTLKDVHDVHL